MVLKAEIVAIECIHCDPFRPTSDVVIVNREAIPEQINNRTDDMIILDLSDECERYRSETVRRIYGRATESTSEKGQSFSVEAVFFG